jgi:hypothetical protein
MLINNDEKIDASMFFDRIEFSVDGINTEMVNKYQVGADFERVMNNVKKIVETKSKRNANKPELIWKYVVFSWNDSREHIEKAFELAKEIGFDKILFTEGLTPNNEAASKRYFEKDFISFDKHTCEKYEEGWGMQFDLK